MSRNPQLEMLKKTKLSYGGELLKTRAGRANPRPVVTNSSMHMVLRSSKAKGVWSFRNPKQAKKIQALVTKFTGKYGVRVLSFANVGNHLHFHLQFTNRQTYKAFIRGLTAAIAMAVTGVSRWTKSKGPLKFWDYRPFTRVVQGYRAWLTLRDYIHLNQLEGYDISRAEARWMVTGNTS